MYDLIEFRSDVRSQFGEDGIIAKIFSEITPANQWCVEFGAWDGVYLSNTWNLLSQGWHGVLIEGNKKKFRDLERATADRRDKITAIQRMIGTQSNTLDEVLATTAIPRDFDFLSIDIDGDDYAVWSSLRHYQPRVVIIESNPTIPFNYEFVQKPGEYIGSSALSLWELGRSKGYELVCYNILNLFMVRSDLAEMLKLRNRSFAYLLSIGQEHTTTIVSRLSGRRYEWGPSTYGRSLWTRRESKLAKVAAQMRALRGTETRDLFENPPPANGKEAPAPPQA